LQRPVWVKALREHGLPEDEVQAVCERISQSYVPWQESTFPGLLGNVIAGRIANRLDLGGTNCVTDAACASALSALSMATHELYLGQSDLVITGGVETFNDIFMYMCFSRTTALSPSGDCRPFDAGADGTMLGEGLGLLALRRLADAERDGDRIYAVIRGIGSSSDGRATSVYAPVPEGQAKALRRAYQAAGYGPDTVELMEAHGTGTRAGDVAEFQALRAVFAETGRADRQWCALGSVKSQIGHTKAAAGAAGLLKVILGLHHKVLPPTLKVSRPNPALAVESSPFHLNTVARPWVREPSHPRRASVSSFGFGGSNFHVTCEEYTGPAPRAFRTRTSPTELVAAAAEHPQALAEECRRLASAGGALADLARASQDRADPAHPARVAVVAGDPGELRRRLEQAAHAVERSPETAFSAPGRHYALGAEPGGVAFLFPGQGSQYIGMGAELAMAFDAAREIWDRAAALSPGDAALHGVVFPRPAFTDEERSAQASRLTATEWAQPAIGATSLSQLALLRELGVRPACVGGHSFGEVTALHVASVLDEESFLRVARRRGELMAAGATEPGGMLAVLAPLSEVSGLLEAGNGTVVVANHNSPGQVVVSGPVAEVDQLYARLRERGVEARRLPVAAAFHSPLVSSVSQPLREFLAEIPFAVPRLPVYANATADLYPSQPVAARALLADQVSRPVRFAEQVEAMHRAGVRTFIEVGPGAVLTGLVGECLTGRSHRAISLDRPGQHGLTGLWNAVGQLWVAGVPMELARLWDSYPPTPQGEREKAAFSLAISGTNYGKPYPPPGGTSALPPPNPRPSAGPPAAAGEVTGRSAAGQPAAGQSAAGQSAAGQPDSAQVAADVPGRFTPAAAAPPPAAPEWLWAYQEMQRQTGEAHAAYLHAMADSHTAFLKAAEASFATLSAMAGGAAPAGVPPEAPRMPEVPEPGPSGEGPPVQIVPPAPPPPSPSPSRPAALPPDGESGNGHIDQLLLAVVADKTGFPAEMLALSMDLEADLGIDSIKRVEILAALQRSVPSLPQLTGPEIASIRTLGQIAERLAEDPQPAADSDPAGRPGHDLATSRPYGQLPGHGAHRPMPGVEPAAVATDRPAPGAERMPVGAAGSGAAVPLAVPTGLGRYAVRAVDATRTGAAVGRFPTSGPVVVTDDGAGIAPALVASLRSRGIDSRVVTQVPPQAGGLIFLGGLRELECEAAVLEVNRQAFHCARTLAQRLATAGGVLVTVQDTGGDFGLSGRAGERAWLGGLPGLVKSAAQEWPHARLRAIDIERAGREPGALAEALAEELLSGGPELEVGLRADGRRLRLEHFECAAVEGPSALDATAVVVASGGARGVTAAALRALARRFRPRMALLGRTGLHPEPAACRGAGDRMALGRVLAEEARSQRREFSPTQLRTEVQSILAAREVRATLDDLRAAGCEVDYIPVDVRDAPSVVAALDRVRARWGPITAVVHGAGTIEDGLILHKSPEQFDRVFDTKVLGLRNLLRATQGDPLRAMVLFSSVAARTGNAGQADYAMANEVLNKVAAAEADRRGQSCLVRSLNWGPWEGGMVTPALRAHFAEHGIPLLPEQAGARMFLDELYDRGDDVEVLLGAAPRPGTSAAFPWSGTPAAFPWSGTPAAFPWSGTPAASPWSGTPPAGPPEHEDAPDPLIDAAD
jgi:acyl transferase domain-containing protein